MATTSVIHTPTDIHRQAVQATPQEMACLLQELLSQRVTAVTIGADVKTVQRWGRGQSVKIRDVDVERRLRTTYEIALLLLSVDAPSTVRAWFISMNDQLEDSSPVEAIQNDRLRDALAAARTFIADA